MIRMQIIRGWSCPVVVCEMCNQPITDYRSGIARYDSASGGEGETRGVIYCHKGRCEQQAAAENAKASREELAHHFFFLMASAGMTKDAIVQELKRWEEAGRNMW